MGRFAWIVGCVFGTTLAATSAIAELSIGKKPTAITLEGDSGGRVEGGGAWSSETLQGKVHVLFHVDPDESETNDHVADALRGAKFPEEKYGSVVIINMAATWIPNMAINARLRSKQKEFPKTLYVRDLDRTVVKKWKLADDSNNVAAFDKSGNVIFSRDGKLSDADVKALLEAIRANL